jgi:ABC-type branched-subunit amino acid transport system ATPase component/ABC-type branched-subunit amino acid transport system permease subunit
MEKPTVSSLGVLSRAPGILAWIGRFREVGLALAILLVLVALPFVTGDLFVIYLIQLAGIYFIVVAGLNLVSGYAGQISVGHASIFGTGAYASAILTTTLRLPFWIGLAGAIALSLVIGILLGVPSLRLRHFYFAMITLGFALTFSDVVLRWQTVTGGWLGISGIPAPMIGPLTITGPFMYGFIVICAALSWIATRNVAHGRWGRILIAVRDSEVSASAMGISPPYAKLVAFALSAVLAGAAGSIYSAFIGSLTPDTFSLQLGLLFFVMMVLGGSSNIWGPVIGVPVLVLLNQVAPIGGHDYLIGGSLIVLTIVFRDGLAGAGKALFGRTARRSHDVEPTSPPLPLHDGATVPIHCDLVLETHALSRSFGGILALNSVDISVRAGEVHAIVGPNGSGKTTLLNVVSGFYPADSGEVHLLGKKVTGEPPYRIARQGFGRTFQTPKISPHLSVLGNVTVAAQQTFPAHLLWDIAGTRGSRDQELRSLGYAYQLLEFVGLASFADQPAGNLPHGLLRFVEIARALAGNPQVVAMDEPAGGLAAPEIVRLKSVIARLGEAGRSVLLVEHNVPFVMEVADRITVLDQGKVIASGQPEAVRRDEEVIRAYLGV